MLEFDQALATPDVETGATTEPRTRLWTRRERTDFDSDASISMRTTSPHRECNPLSVAVDGLGNLYVGDDGDHRVLEFNQPLAAPDFDTGAGDVTADLVFGQGSSGTDFTDTTCYDGVGEDPAPSAVGICDLNGIALDSSGDLYVTDVGNSRVLEFNQPLAAPDPDTGVGDVTADLVFGQNSSFATGVCGGTAASGIAPSGSVLCQPDGVTLDGAGDIFVADSSNNRVLEYTTPQSIPPAASLVLGQMDLAHNGVDNPTAAALQLPQGVAIDSSATPNHLYVADSVNNRVLGWATPPASPTTNPPISSSASPTRCQRIATTASPGAIPTDSARTVSAIRPTWPSTAPATFM